MGSDDCGSRMTDGNRREYFRVDDSVVLDYRVISEQELPALVDDLRRRSPTRFTAAAEFAATSRHMNRLLHKIRRVSPDLVRYLEAVDGKLNTLARLFLLEELDPPQQTAREVSLSAGGIGFRARGPLTAGDLVELKLVLLPSHTGVLTFGRVVYCEPCSAGDAEFPHFVAIEFDQLRETDRELLVRHLLGRQNAARERPSDGDD
ncbi:MAG: PilZ domain-containing protein [Gammaproteobacteria bacterium]